MSNNASFQVLIIGGGAAGITVASQLQKQNSNVKMAIIEPSENHYYQPAWTLVGGGEYLLEDTVKHEQNLIPQGVTWIKDYAEKIEPEQNKVTTKNGKIYDYEYLVVCLGITIDWDKIKGLKPGCLLVPENEKRKKTFDFPVIWVKNPKAAFSLILSEKEKEKFSYIKAGISPKSEISPKAVISKSAYIGPFCFVGDEAVISENAVLVSGVYVGNKVFIGKNSKIYPNVTIREDCYIGQDCIIHSGCVIGADGYGYIQANSGHEKVPQIGAVRISDRVELGANSCVDRATLGFTEIGEGSKIDNLVHIAHNVKIGKNCLIIAQAGIAGSSVIGDNVIIAGQAGISDHVVIGDNSIIMAKTGVIGKVPPKSVLFGYLGRPRGEYMRIEALLSKLPEFFSFYKKVKKLLNLNETNDK